MSSVGRIEILQKRMDLVRRFSMASASKSVYHFFSEQLATLNKIADGSPYIASTYYVPGELLSLFDIPVLFVERTAGFAAANGIISQIDKHRFPSNCCSYQQFLNALIEESILPLPSILIGARYACDDAWMYFRYLSNEKHIPFYFLDVSKGDSDENAIVCLGNQIEELYLFLKERFLLKYSLYDIVETSNRTMEIKGTIDAMRITYPGIVKSEEMLKIFTLYNDLGKTYVLKIFQELFEFIRAKTSEYKPEKKPHILWLGVLPLYRNKILNEIESKFNCSIVYEELLDYGQDRISVKSFFMDLAKRIISNLYFSQYNRITGIVKYVNEMNIDGIIHFSQRNCRFLNPMVPFLHKTLTEYHVPFIEFEGDAMNPVHFDEKKYWECLNAFFEIIKLKKGS